jgi:hypothetical protein
MTRRADSRIGWRVVVVVAIVGVLGSCGSGIGLPAAGGDRLHEQARDALARYDQALRAAGGQGSFVPVGELIGQVGTWELANGDHKLALMSGRVIAVAALPSLLAATGQVRWDSGEAQTLPLIGAQEALAQLVASADSTCDTCAPLEVTGAQLSTARIQTTRGPATAPVWEYSLRGTDVRVTRVAVARSATVIVTPPSWDPHHAPDGRPIESAKTSLSSRQLTVTFAGAPQGPASDPCAADYTGEAVESANAVVVIVSEHAHATGDSGGQVCPTVGQERTATVNLAQPLGERAVLEVRQGLPVPVTITA